MHQLVSLYRYDLSEFADWPVPADGCYVYHGLETYWEESFIPLLVKVNNELAGFVILAHEEKSGGKIMSVLSFLCCVNFVVRGLDGM